MPAPIRELLYCAVKVFGRRIRDCKTGQVYGRAFVFFWAGRLHLIGYRGKPVRPVWLGMANKKYWKSELGFTTQEEPDYDRIVS